MLIPQVGIYDLSNISFSFYIPLSYGDSYKITVVCLSVCEFCIVLMN